MSKTIYICTILLTLSLPALAQYEATLIQEGEGVDGLKVGVSTRAEIISKYGDTYELMTHDKYSTELDYTSKGLSFYFCQGDPIQEVFVIELGYPQFSGRTLKGAVLGLSTRREVLALYSDELTITTSDSQSLPDTENKPGSENKSVDVKISNTDLSLDYPGMESSDMEIESDAQGFKGVEFSYGTIDGYGDDVLTSIDIVEKKGLRQCNSKFGKIEDK